MHRHRRAHLLADDWGNREPEHQDKLDRHTISSFRHEFVVPQPYPVDVSQ
jgi:hypothetical protein